MGNIISVPRSAKSESQLITVYGKVTKKRAMIAVAAIFRPARRDSQIALDLVDIKRVENRAMVQQIVSFSLLRISGKFFSAGRQVAYSCDFNVVERIGKGVAHSRENVTIRRQHFEQLGRPAVIKNET